MDVRKLIIEQFRWLDTIGDNCNDFCQKLLDHVEMGSGKFQEFLIQSLSEILPDSQHNNAAQILFGLNCVCFCVVFMFAVFFGADTFQISNSKKY